MSRLPRITGKDTLAALLRAGMVQSHVRGSHHYLKWPKGTILVCVPIHAGKILRIGTLRSILEQSGLDIDSFLELL